MDDLGVDDEDRSAPTAGKPRSAETAEERAARLSTESAELVDALKSADFSALKTRVAGILNEYPHTRNSDVALALKYWEVFQSDLFNPRGIAPKDLFKLERQPNIVRVRAKIQNE